MAHSTVAAPLDLTCAELPSLPHCSTAGWCWSFVWVPSGFNLGSTSVGCVTQTHSGLFYLCIFGPRLWEGLPARLMPCSFVLFFWRGGEALGLTLLARLTPLLLLHPVSTSLSLQTRSLSAVACSRPSSHPSFYPPGLGWPQARSTPFKTQ